MADYSLADYLQGRNALEVGADAPLSRLAKAMTYGKGSVQPIAPPQPGLAHNLLSMFGQPSLDLLRGVADEWQRTGQEPQRNPWDVIGTMPMGPFGMARIPGRATDLSVRPMSNRALHEIGEANFINPYVVDPVREVPIGSLSGQHYDPSRVGPLANRIRENNWIEPLVVDRAGNVVEGQHRLRALGQLGVDDVPVHRLRELDATGIAEAAGATGIHREHASQIAQQIAEIVDREGLEALGQYLAPHGFEAAWQAAVTAAKRAR